MEAFALTGRNYNLYIIPRVLPWARSFCPFRAYGANLVDSGRMGANLVDSGRMGANLVSSVRGAYL